MDSRQHAPLPVNPVGDLLRGWRNRRAMSQADLAFEAGISIKHLSYVETGKAAGSRDILLQLAPRSGCRCATATRSWKRAGLPGNMASAISPRPKSPMPSAPSICCCGGTSRSRPSSPTAGGLAGCRRGAAGARPSRGDGRAA